MVVVEGEEDKEGRREEEKRKAFREEAEDIHRRSGRGEGKKGRQEKGRRC